MYKFGEKNVFPVDCDIGETIGHLKGAIKKKKIVSLRNTDASALKLWKVNIPESKKYEIYEGIDIKVKFGGEELDSDLRTIGARTLPKTLKYRDPQSLLKGGGSSWDFQASEALKQELKHAIHNHFKFWKAGKCEKTTIPQYFILAGAGEGKSRTAQELPKLLIECTNDIDLKNRLRSALVFNLSFENETKLFREVETNSSYAIGNRMLFQLLQQPGESWDSYMNRYKVTPAEVLSRVAKHRNQKLNDLNVIVILDGIQVAMKKAMDGTDQGFLFYDCISILCILSLLGPFIITCCTATISMPIHSFLDSSQLRVFLPVTSLQPPRINGNPVFVDNPVMKMLINDMGGHGRALEALEESIRGKDLDNINFIDLINDVRSNISNKYQEWLSKTIYLKPVLRIILSRTQVDKNQKLATFEGKKITVDDVTQFGLVRFESRRADEVVGYLTCPYVWLWIMAGASRNGKLLRNWYFNNKAGNPSIPPGCQYWQNFDNFVAQFRILKSNIYGDNEQVELRVIHNGAKHNFGDSSIYNRELILEQSVKRVSTKSGNYKQSVKILCQDGEIDVTKASHILINESGDSFCSIKMVGTELLQTETHQCKLVKQIISQERFKDEHEKATSSGDTFVLYTLESSKKLELHQPMTAIVSKDNWEEYFGSFARRCYNYAMEPPNLNEATYTQLTGINFIGEARARIIMEERNKCEFSGIDDCERRTKIPRTYLEPFF
ncbi:8972_t:CDS:2 [Acaulospora morrowiae]|uniref:8972_t:CDS:1 n=1 Tax=Acaulospora morrowiae TaxID=94023 RepID=A0A9N8VAG3_9GLOM|nr:8972_t:CDS:2 [Acaulospora morrowiae]